MNAPFNGTFALKSALYFVMRHVRTCVPSEQVAAPLFMSTLKEVLIVQHIEQYDVIFTSD